VPTGSQTHHSATLAGTPTTPGSAGLQDDERQRERDRASRSSTRSPLPTGRPTAARTTAKPTPRPAPPRTSAAPKPSPTPRPSPRRTTESPTPRSAPIQTGGEQYVAVGPSFSGEASFYGGGDGTDGGPTASGETFDANALTAASRTLPFNTLLNVCYQGRCVVVRINDRGPFIDGRILDLSLAAARAIGMEEVGVAYVTATPVQPAN
jgi:rare lipoprotein A (peptidoglycan hydrolase)